MAFGAEMGRPTSIALKAATSRGASSPNGARFDSPGREPWERFKERTRSPNGARPDGCKSRSLESRPVGALCLDSHFPRASLCSPWAIESRPFGALAIGWHALTRGRAWQWRATGSQCHGRKHRQRGILRGDGRWAKVLRARRSPRPSLTRSGRATRQAGEGNQGGRAIRRKGLCRNSGEFRQGEAEGSFSGGGRAKIQVFGAEFLSKKRVSGSKSGRFPGRRARVFQYL